MEKNILLILLLFSFFSCKKESETYTMYGFLNEEFVLSNSILKKQIQENLSNSKLVNDKSAELYHNLTTEYIEYLESVYSELISNPKIGEEEFYDGELSKKEYINSFFFNGEKYNDKSLEFISKLKNYKTEILKLISDEHLANKMRDLLNIDFIMTREGKKIEYLNYIYKDLPLISVLTHMKYRIHSIHEFENEFLKNRLLNQ